MQKGATTTYVEADGTSIRAMMDLEPMPGVMLRPVSLNTMDCEDVTMECDAWKHVGQSEYETGKWSVLCTTCSEVNVVQHWEHARVGAKRAEVTSCQSCILRPRGGERDEGVRGPFRIGRRFSGTAVEPKMESTSLIFLVLSFFEIRPTSTAEGMDKRLRLTFVLKVVEETRAPPCFVPLAKRLEFHWAL